MPKGREICIESGCVIIFVVRLVTFNTKDRVFLMLGQLC
jgi:hypothetical protein